MTYISETLIQTISYAFSINCFFPSYFNVIKAIAIFNFFHNKYMLLMDFSSSLMTLYLTKVLSKFHIQSEHC